MPGPHDLDPSKNVPSQAFQLDMFRPVAAFPASSFQYDFFLFDQNLPHLTHVSLGGLKANLNILYPTPDFQPHILSHYFFFFKELDVPMKNLQLQFNMPKQNMAVSVWSLISFFVKALGLSAGSTGWASQGGSLF